MVADGAAGAEAVAVSKVVENLIERLRPAAVAAEQPVFNSHDIDLSLTTQMTRHGAPHIPEGRMHLMFLHITRRLNGRNPSTFFGGSRRPLHECHATQRCHCP